MDTAGLCIEQTNDVVVATATMQYLTEPEATALVDELIGCIRYDAAHFFVLNLTQVQRITSSAIQALLILFQELEHVRGRVVLANCQPNVESVFETTRLDALFELYEDIDEAVEAVTP
jgi:anti-anti-sigma factor